jgi:hypothetical protein
VSSDLALLFALCFVGEDSHLTHLLCVVGEEDW